MKLKEVERLNAIDNAKNMSTIELLSAYGEMFKQMAFDTCAIICDELRNRGLVFEDDKD